MLHHFRRHLATTIHSNTVQNALTVILLIDVLGTLALLELESDYPACEFAQQVCQNASSDCNPDPEGIARGKELLSLMSTSVLFIFSVEILLLIFAVGIVHFVTEPLYLFDGLVVTTSVVVEITVGRRHHISGLLVFARAWRFVTLVHSMDSLRRLRLQRDDTLEDPLIS